jgi:hypothetical protein
MGDKHLSMVNVFVEFDITSNGGLNFKEFCLFIKCASDDIYKNEMRSIFDLMDKNRSGYVSTQEFSDFWEITNFQKNYKQLTSFGYAEGILVEINKCLRKQGFTPHKFVSRTGRLSKEKFKDL